ncbi:hypothetical protein [Atopomonas hussainii]|uniref:hypothetical protein n=1 Tax=Atopomonas hussainii TaxID=1429083 RepID=UPI0009000619|nr:hypothetical protein [Atopomonas hussainii]
MQVIQGVACSIVAALALLAPCSASAFKLNPCLRVLVYDKHILEQEKIRQFNQCGRAPEQLRHAVHEHMTNFAIDEYRGSGFLINAAKSPADVKSGRQVLNYMTDPSWNKSPSATVHNTHAIIFGSWWNDDPLMYTWGSGGDFVKGLRRLKKQFDNSSTYYAGGVANCDVAANDFLGWHSHFGPLQYLHFMTNLDNSHGDQERLDDTLNRSLIWIEFAYKVATGALPPDAPLTEQDEHHLGLPSISKNYCLSTPDNTKIRTLFARAGVPIALRDQRTPDVALGSIFHILQDSFSPSHTCRVEMRVNGQYVAALKHVYNYSEQDHKAHGRMDTYPGWLLTYAKTGEHVYANDPVVVGAWLLKAVDAKTPWIEVKEYLLRSIFVKQTETSANGKSSCIGSRGA